jgi:hypothetical protein
VAKHPPRIPPTAKYPPKKKRRHPYGKVSVEWSGQDTLGSKAPERRPMTTTAKYPPENDSGRTSATKSQTQQ